MVSNMHIAPGLSPSEVVSMRCVNCYNSIADDVEFCPSCSFPIIKPRPAAGWQAAAELQGDEPTESGEGLETALPSDAPAEPAPAPSAVGLAAAAAAAKPALSPVPVRTRPSVAPRSARGRRPE